MGVDLAVATPVFLDYTFVGLEGLPGPGEERFAGDLLRSPGGGAITAIGAVRLGLSAAVAAPLGRDLPGTFVRESLKEEGIVCREPADIRTPVTVVMPVAGERSMVTVDPGVRARRADVEALEPRAVSVNLELIDRTPEGPLTYVTCGDDDARAFARRIPAQLSQARTLFVNRREACVLTGADTAEDAARALAETVATVVVTLGADGAFAVVEGQEVAVAGEETGRVVDATGAGDLFAAAYAWADLLGADPETRMRWANLYAALSVTTPTGVGGAATREVLLAEGSRRGLLALPGAAERGTTVP
jgi:sugar/nucleoside kinase (ribokinase family)